MFMKRRIKCVNITFSEFRITGPEGIASSVRVTPREAQRASVQTGGAEQ